MWSFPRASFPQQDTGLIIGISEAAQDISFQAMSERQQALLNIVLKDPAVDSVGSAIGAGGGNYTVNNGRVFIALKPQNQRDASADQVISAAARPGSPRSRASRSTCRRRRTSPSAGACPRPSISIRWPTPIPASSTTGHRCSWTSSRQLPGITDVATDQLNARTAARHHGQSRRRLELRHPPSTIDNTLDDAFGQRIVSTMYTTLNQYHVVLEVSPQVPVRAGSTQ